MTKASIAASTAQGVDFNKAYIGLLGGSRKDGYYDHRVGLFISILRLEANKNKRSNEKYRGSAVEQTPETDDAMLRLKPGFRFPDGLENDSMVGTSVVGFTTKFRTGNVFFSRVPDVLKKGEPLQMPFLRFLCDLCNRLNVKSTDNIYGSLEFITKYVPSLTPKNQGEYNFAIAVVQLFLAQIIDDKGENIIDSPNKWKDATRGVYHTKKIIINNLFPQPKIKSPYTAPISKDAEGIYLRKYYAHGGGTSTVKQHLIDNYVPQLSVTNKQFTDLYEELNAINASQRDPVYSEVMGRIIELCDSDILVIDKMRNYLFLSNSVDDMKTHNEMAFQTIPYDAKSDLLAIVTLAKQLMKMKSKRDPLYSSYRQLIKKIEDYSKYISKKLDEIHPEPPSPPMSPMPPMPSSVPYMESLPSFSKRDELQIINEYLQTCEGISPDNTFPTYDIKRFLEKLSESIHKDAQKVVDDILNDKTGADPDVDSAATPIDILRDKLGLSGEDNQTQYYREPGNPEVLYIKRPGKEAKDARENDDTTGRCKSGLLSDYADESKCNDFLFSCLAGKDVSGCKKFLISPTFWTKDSTNFLNNINLYKASEAFMKYGIPLENVEGLAKFKDTEAWIAHLHALANEDPLIISETDITAIRTNKEFIALIDRTIKLINDTPTILNKSVTKSTPVTVTPSPDPVSGLIANPIRNGGSHSLLHNTHVRALTQANLAKSSITTTKAFNSIQAQITKLQQDLLRMAGRQHPSIGLIARPLFAHPLHSKYASTGGAKIPDDITSMDAAHNILDNFNLNTIDHTDDMRQIMTDLGDIKMNEPESLQELLNTLITRLEKDGLTVDKKDISIVESAMEGLKAYRKTILTIILFLYFQIIFFRSTVTPALLSTGLESGDPANDKKLRELYSSQKMNLKKLSEMVKIGVAKLEKYCSKGDKHGQICDNLIIESLKYIK